MMFFALADVIKTPYPVVARIEQPKMVAPNPAQGSSLIVHPDSSASHHIAPNEPLERPDERLQRLRDAKIIPTPTPVPTPLSNLDKALDHLAQQVEATEGLLTGIRLRTELGFGSWKMVVRPKNVRVIEDFSYNFSAMQSLDPLPLQAETWVQNSLVGIESIFWNDGIYYNYTNAWNQRSPMYADRATTEMGVAYSHLFERQSSRLAVWFIDLRTTFLFLRWVKTSYYTPYEPPRGTEATSHFTVNIFGFGGETAAGINFARTVGASFFAGLHLADPFQIRIRGGIKLQITAP